MKRKGKYTVYYDNIRIFDYPVTTLGFGTSFLSFGLDSNLSHKADITITPLSFAQHSPELTEQEEEGKEKSKTIQLPPAKKRTLQMHHECLNRANEEAHKKKRKRKEREKKKRKRASDS
ncbi:hypothetical protein L873DRAFT_1805735, partial [Choiromyces venosus 120613-1]